MRAATAPSSGQKVRLVAEGFSVPQIASAHAREAASFLSQGSRKQPQSHHPSSTSTFAASSSSSFEPFLFLLQRVGRGCRDRRRCGCVLAVNEARRKALEVVVARVAVVVEKEADQAAGVKNNKKSLAAITIQRVWRGAMGRQRVGQVLEEEAINELVLLRNEQIVVQKVAVIHETIAASVALRRAAYTERRRRERVLTTTEAVLIQKVARGFRARHLLLAVMRGLLGKGLTGDQKHRRMAWLSSTASYCAEQLARRKVIMMRFLLDFRDRKTEGEIDDGDQLESFHDNRNRSHTDSYANIQHDATQGLVDLLIRNNKQRARSRVGSATPHGQAPHSVSSYRSRSASNRIPSIIMGVDVGIETPLATARKGQAVSGLGGSRPNSSSSPQRLVPVDYKPLPERPDGTVEAAHEALARGVRHRSATRIQEKYRRSVTASKWAMGLEGFAYLTELNEKAAMIQHWFRAVLRRRRTFSKRPLPRPTEGVLAARNVIQRVEALAVRNVQRDALVAMWRLATDDSTLNPRAPHSSSVVA